MKLSGWKLPLVLVAALVLAGCKRNEAELAAAPDAGVEDAAAAAVPPADPATPAFELTWHGVLPCADCQGIDTRLVLRGEGEQREFELQETYLGVDGENTFDASGAWNEERGSAAGDDAVIYRLDPVAGERRFLLLPDGALEELGVDGQRLPDAAANRLQRL